MTGGASNVTASYAQFMYEGLINPFHLSSIGSYLYASGLRDDASASSPSANEAFYIPFCVAQARIAYKLGWWNGTAADNADVGIYDAAGTRLVSTGSTAAAGNSQLQTVDTTDQLLLPGRTYYMAWAVSGTTGTFRRALPSVGILSLIGIWVEASAFPLPSTATFAKATSENYVPVPCVLTRSYV